MKLLMFMAGAFPVSDEAGDAHSCCLSCLMPFLSQTKLVMLMAVVFPVSDEAGDAHGCCLSCLR